MSTYSLQPLSEILKFCSKELPDVKVCLKPAPKTIKLPETKQYKARRPQLGKTGFFKQSVFKDEIRKLIEKYGSYNIVESKLTAILRDKGFKGIILKRIIKDLRKTETKAKDMVLSYLPYDKCFEKYFEEGTIKREFGRYRFISN